MSRGDGAGPAGCFGSKGREMCCSSLGTRPSCPKYSLPDCAAGTEPSESELVLSAQGWDGAMLQYPDRSLENFRLILDFPDTFQLKFPKHVSNNRQFVLLLPLSGLQMLFSFSTEAILCTGKLLGLCRHAQCSQGWERIYLRVPVLSSPFYAVSAGFGSMVLHKK